MSKKFPGVVYDEKSDSLYMIISEGRQEGYIELPPDINLETGTKDKVIGLEILRASKVLKNEKKPWSYCKNDVKYC